MFVEYGRKSENLARKKPALLQMRPPKPAQIRLPIQLPSTLRIVQSKLLLFHLTCLSIGTTDEGGEKLEVISSTEF